MSADAAAGTPGPVPFETASVTEGPALVWRFDAPRGAISSATIMDGVRSIGWISNAPRSYSATVPTEVNLSGDGLALLSAGSVDQPVTLERTEIRIDATVAIAALSADTAAGAGAIDPVPAGLVNAVIQLPVGFEAGAALSAAITVAEAKTQALIEAGAVKAGSADDALVLCWPTGAPIERQAGPRSTWGGRLATIVHQAILRGAKAAPR